MTSKAYLSLYIGLETERLVQSADAKMQRKMTWDYHPDGKVKKTYDAGLRTPDSQVFDYKRLEYAYDANGNLVETKDQSTGAKLDTYRMSYTSMNQVAKIEDISKGVVKNKREFEYDRNGNIDSQEDPLTRSMFYYDTMNQVEQLASREAGTKEYQWTKYERTPNGQISKVTKPNEMTTSYTYYLDALLKEMETKKKDGTTIQKHALEYNANGHRTKDIYTGIDADKKAFNYTYTYQYDPRDRLVEYNKTGTSSSKEQYVLDANSNIISKTRDGVATNYQYDRDRLISETTSGKTKKYEYDSIGRVSQIKMDDITQEEYKYDVFDNIKEHQKLSQKTQYEYDALDRTTSKTENAGTSSAKKIKYNYLGTGGQVISEEVDDIIARSYTYSPWGERLSMTKKVAQGSETSYYLNNTDVDVEMLLDEQGDVRATYGYTPYGENDDALFSGVDKPDPKNPNKEMYNAYRYSGKPWDPNTKSYDLGFRNYFPEQGRYLTADSYTDSEKYRGLLMDAQNYNVYGYTGGNPVSNHDPDGHEYQGIYMGLTVRDFLSFATGGEESKPLGAPYDPRYRKRGYIVSGTGGKYGGGGSSGRSGGGSSNSRSKNAYKQKRQTSYPPYRGKFGAERGYVEEMRSTLTLEEKQVAQNIFDGVLFGIGLFLAPEYEASSGFRFWLSTTRFGRSAGKYIDKVSASIAGFFGGKSSTPTPTPTPKLPLNLQAFSKKPKVMSEVSALKENAVHHILQDKHAWGRVTKDPKNWDSVAPIVSKVMEKGVESRYKGVRQKSLDIGGETVEVIFARTPAGEIKIGNAWVKTE